MIAESMTWDERIASAWQNGFTEDDERIAAAWQMCSVAEAIAPETPNRPFYNANPLLKELAMKFWRAVMHNDRETASLLHSDIKARVASLKRRVDHRLPYGYRHDLPIENIGTKE